jgi:hypothetical protein
VVCRVALATTLAGSKRMCGKAGSPFSTMTTHYIGRADAALGEIRG